jgi:hypothetical protein
MKINDLTRFKPVKSMPFIVRTYLKILPALKVTCNDDKISLAKGDGSLLNTLFQYILQGQKIYLASNVNIIHLLFV